MLERIYHRHVGPEQHNPFQMLNTGARIIRIIVKAAFILVPVGRRKQFHRHRGHFGKLHTNFTLVNVRQRHGLESVEGVPRLVHHRAHITLQPDRIHEDEGAARYRKLNAVAAGRFAFAVRQV